jgi:cellulose synthase/poly-beta-1,6-N-acetylglucosamine synthase-like glycosyltransferase
MLIILVIIWVITLSYVALMLVYWFGWNMQPKFVLKEGFIPKTRISIIIPARNEEGTISACIRSILKNNYPSGLLEIIVIDDHSEDNTAAIVRNHALPNVKCLRMADYLKEGEVLNAYKKKAIEIGIANSSGELIITTDADCIAPKEWLNHIAAKFEHEHPVMIVGPVSFTNNGNMVERFQDIDFMSMQGITGAAHRLGLGNMSNGANLAFSRSAFQHVKGYDGIDHLASGDDFLLMVKMKKAFPDQIAYLKSRQAIVTTSPQPDWLSLLQQRIRWASKSGKYNDPKLTLILLLVYIFNLLFLVLFIAGLSDINFMILLSGIFIIKTVVEAFYLFPVAIFFRKSQQLFLFPLLQPFHILYVIIAGFLGFIGVYKWKGRRVK